MGCPVEEKDLTVNRSVCSSLLTTEGNTVYGSKSGSFMDVVGGEDWSSRCFHFFKETESNIINQEQNEAGDLRRKEKMQNYGLGEGK